MLALVFSQKYNLYLKTESQLRMILDNLNESYF